MGDIYVCSVICSSSNMFEKLPFLICLFVFSSANEVEQKKDSRQFSLFSIVTFKNDECSATSTSGLKGVCMTSTECSSVGTADGNCASAFGVCCIIKTSTCGGSVTAPMPVRSTASLPSNNLWLSSVHGFSMPTGLILKNLTFGTLFGLSSLLPLLPTGSLNNLNVLPSKNSRKKLVSSEPAQSSEETLSTGLPLVCSLALQLHIWFLSSQSFGQKITTPNLKALHRHLQFLLLKQ